MTDDAFGLAGFGGAKDGTIGATCLLDLRGDEEGKDGTDAAFGLTALGAGAGGKHGGTFPSNT